MYSQPRYWMEVSDQLHAPAALTPGKAPGTIFEWKCFIEFYFYSTLTKCVITLYIPSVP
jgi:hypothetical protein